MVLAFSVQAQTLEKQRFEDQWGKQIELNEQVKWLVVTQSKEASQIVKKSFVSLGISNLNQFNILYLVDISAIPSFIARVFALPKMRAYPFQVGLLKEEGALASLKLKNLESEKVRVIRLNHLKVIDTQWFESDIEFKAFLRSKIIGQNRINN